MASEEDHNHVYGEEDLDEDDDDESEDDHSHRIAPRNDAVYEDDDDVDIDDDDSTSSSNLAAADGHPPPPHPLAISNAASEVTIAVAGVPIGPIAGDSIPGPKRQRVVDDVSMAAVVEEKKPVPVPLDESRRLFQRLWTDEDEIELLQGFLEYTTQRGASNSSHHLDTSAFYDQIKSKLQLDFNKNQLVEKLRRLKKKYRNVLSKLGSGKDFVFKSPHDQATFEISQKIWSLPASGRSTAGGDGGEEGGFDDEDANTNPNINSIDHNHNGGIDVNYSADKKVQRSRKRSRAIKVGEKQVFYLPQSSLQQQPAATPTATPTQTRSSTPAATPSIPSLIEDTVRSCLSPLFKELLHNAMNGSCGSRGFGFPLNPMPLGFGGQMNFNGGDVANERWRKQQILELEVYSKRLELVQDQIKSQLEELRSMGS